MPGQPLPIAEVAARAGLAPDELELFGRSKAKIRLEALDRLRDRPLGKYVAVTAITPTPLGEGKTVTTIGLAQALHLTGRPTFACLRQPSQGPTFGLKGGAAGGGQATLFPMQDINLHFTGDFHAVAAAHNLLAAALDAHLFHGNRLGVDPSTISLKRVLDVNDRALRSITIGQGERNPALARPSGFEITAASEVMAILALARDRADLRARLGRMIVALDGDGAPVTPERLGVAGAMAVLLKDALLPNLVQTAEGSPALVHAGPFANIAHGNSSVLADLIALRLADYVVTESGFGADLGFEKLADIKCRASGLAPDCAVVVATVRALKAHGGVGPIVAGRPLPDELLTENLPALERGCANLDRQIRNVLAFGVPAVVAINAFPTDTLAEIELIQRRAVAAGALSAQVSRVFAEGGQGGVELAEAVAEACQRPASFAPLYPDDLPTRDKIDTIARRLYGAAGVELLPAAVEQCARWEQLDLGCLPVCMAKTQLSLSHDPKLLGAPSGFVLPVREVRASAGAGFLYALCGSMLTMPGLPPHPNFERIDLVDGQVTGLF